MLHIRRRQGIGNGKRKRDWAVWAPVSQCQNNGLFKSLASELAVSHQERKELAVPLRTPSLHKGQRCQLSLPCGCLSVILGAQGPGLCSPHPTPTAASLGTCYLLRKADHLVDSCLPKQEAVTGQEQLLWREPRTSCASQNLPPRES